MNKFALLTGSFLGGLSVAFGAFGTHGLGKFLDPTEQKVFMTGVQYQFYHSLSLIMVGILSRFISGSGLKWTSLFLFFGIIFFSGSLDYISILTIMHDTTPVFIGILTPLGGLFLLFGWVTLFFSILWSKEIQPINATFPKVR